MLDMSRYDMSTEDRRGGTCLDDALRKKYIPMTETTYYTLLAVTTPRHGYAIMQFVGRLTRERLLLGTGTLYTMVGRLAADGIIQVLQTGMELLGEETKRLGQQLADGLKILSGGA